MGLSDIAAAVGTTTEERERTSGVATVDATAPSLAERLAPYGDDLPCSPAEAAAVVEAYGGGAAVGEAARAAGVAPVTAAKALHRLGVDGVSPLSPMGRRVVRDWLDAEVTRSAALDLTGASEEEFALAAFVESHDQIDGARAAVDRALGDGGLGLVEKRDRLAGTMSGPGDLR